MKPIKNGRDYYKNESKNKEGVIVGNNKKKR